MILGEYADRLAPFMAQSPVDVGGAARELGLEVFSTKLESGISGILRKDSSFKTPSGFIILVNEKEPVVRQRFTAAHEIGHYVLHRDLIGDGVTDNYLYRTEGIGNRQEVQANQFAADLLMPHALIEERMQHGSRTVDALADDLNVSRIAMGIRLGLPT